MIFLGSVKVDSSEGNLIVRDRGRLIGTPATHKYVEETLRHLEEKTGIHASCHTLRRFYAQQCRMPEWSWTPSAG